MHFISTFKSNMSILNANCICQNLNDCNVASQPTLEVKQFDVKPINSTADDCYEMGFYRFCRLVEPEKKSPQRCTQETRLHVHIAALMEQQHQLICRISVQTNAHFLSANNSLELKNTHKKKLTESNAYAICSAHKCDIRFATEIIYYVSSLKSIRLLLAVGVCALYFLYPSFNDIERDTSNCESNEFYTFLRT